jgi:hypothetical protein
LLRIYDLSAPSYIYVKVLGRCYVGLSIVRHSTQRVSKILIETGTLEVRDSDAILRMIQAATSTPDGRLGADLKARLAEMSASDTAKVVVWFRTTDGIDVAARQQRAYGELGRTNPRVAENLSSTGTPFGDEERAEALRIDREYHRLMTTGVVHTHVASALESLVQRGARAKDLAPMPAIHGQFSRGQIEDFSRDLNVDAIYLIEAPVQPVLQDAAESQWIDRVWAKGITGDGWTIAILEPGNIQRNNSYLNLHSSYWQSPIGETDHATNVAAAAASTYDQAPGPGRGATLLSVGTGTDPDTTVLGLEWVISPPYSVKIVNFSACVYSRGALGYLARAFDFWSRTNNVLIVAGAGNQGTSSDDYVCSPANGYNVLGVGSFANANTASWSDDTMWDFSSWRNPPSAMGDREKPELVAVGRDVRLWGWNNAYSNPISGTSIAAPQVSGLAALMLNTHPTIWYFPNAMRAILMASAIHNVEGSPRLASGVDAHDGAGAIVGDLAVEAASTAGEIGAPCANSCWWSAAIKGAEPNYTVQRLFSTHAGQPVRVAIAWQSTADSYPYANDVLDIDLDLRIKDPYWVDVVNGTSLSYDNAYEFVDFVAPYSGVYTIQIKKVSSASAPDNSVGIALVMPQYRAFAPLLQR